MADLNEYEDAVFEPDQDDDSQVLDGNSDAGAYTEPDVEYESEEGRGPDYIAPPSAQPMSTRPLFGYHMSSPPAPAFKYGKAAMKAPNIGIRGKTAGQSSKPQPAAVRPHAEEQGDSPDDIRPSVETSLLLPTENARLNDGRNQGTAAQDSERRDALTSLDANSTMSPQKNQTRSSKKSSVQPKARVMQTIGGKGSIQPGIDALNDAQTGDEFLITADYERSAGAGTAIQSIPFSLDNTSKSITTANGRVISPLPRVPPQDNDTPADSLLDFDEEDVAPPYQVELAANVDEQLRFRSRLSEGRLPGTTKATESARQRETDRIHHQNHDPRAPFEADGEETTAIGDARLNPGTGRAHGALSAYVPNNNIKKTDHPLRLPSVPFPESTTPARSRRSRPRPNDASPQNNRPLRAKESHISGDTVLHGVLASGGTSKQKRALQPSRVRTATTPLPQPVTTIGDQRQLNSSNGRIKNGASLNSPTRLSNSHFGRFPVASGRNQALLAVLGQLLSSDDAHQVEEVRKLKEEIGLLQSEVSTLQGTIDEAKAAREASRAAMAKKVDKMKTHFASLAQWNREAAKHFATQKAQIEEFKSDAKMFDEAFNMVPDLSNRQRRILNEIETIRTKAHEDVAKLNLAHGQELENKLHALQAEKLKVQQLETNNKHVKKEAQLLKARVREMESDQVDTILDERDDAILNKIDAQSEYLLRSLTEKNEAQATTLIEAIENIDLKPATELTVLNALDELKQMLADSSRGTANTVSEKDAAKEALLDTGNKLLATIEAKVNSITADTSSHAQLTNQIIDLESAKSRFEILSQKQIEDITKLQEQVEIKDRLIAQNQELLRQKCVEIEQLQAQLQKQNLRIQSLEAVELSLREANNHKNRLQEANEKLSNDLENLQISNKSTIEERDESIRRLQIYQETSHDISESGQRLEAEKQAAIVRAQSAEELLANAQTAMRQQQEAVSREIAKQVEKQRVKIEEEKRHAIKQEKLQNSQKVSGQQRRIEELQNDLAQSKSINATLQSSLSALQGQAESLTSVNNELVKKLAKTTDEAQRFRSDLVPLKEALVSQQQEITSLIKSFEKHRLSASTTPTAMHDLKNLIDKLVAECDSQHAKLSQYQAFEVKLKVFCKQRAVLFDDVDFDGLMIRLSASFLQEAQEKAQKPANTVSMGIEAVKADVVVRVDSSGVEIQVPASPLIEDSQFGASGADVPPSQLSSSPFNLPKAKRNARIAVRRRSSLLDEADVVAPTPIVRRRLAADFTAHRSPGPALADTYKKMPEQSLTETNTERTVPLQELSSEDVISYMTPVKRNADVSSDEPHSTPLTDLEDVIEMMMSEPAADPIAALEQQRRERDAKKQIPVTVGAPTAPVNTTVKKTLKRPTHTPGSKPLKSILKRTTSTVVQNHDSETVSTSTTAVVAAAVPERQLLQPPKHRRSLSFVGIGFHSSQEAHGEKATPKRAARDVAPAAQQPRSSAPKTVSAPNVSVPRSQSRKRTSLSGAMSMDPPSSAAKRPRMSIPYSQKPTRRAAQPQIE